MKINFDKAITDLNGNPLKEGDEEITLKGVCVSALMAAFPDEKLPGTDKLKRFRLADAIYSANGPLEVSSEDISLLKKLVGDGWGVLIVGRALPLLETPAQD